MHLTMQMGEILTGKNFGKDILQSSLTFVEER